MQLYSWNVNGIRATLGKGLAQFVETHNPDILCLQETKARAEQVGLPEVFAPYHAFWNSAQKAGYSGTAIFSKIEPLRVDYGLGVAEHDQEGRVIAAEFADFTCVTVYTPNAQDELKRLDYRLAWDAAFLRYLRELEQQRGKPVVCCGDFNVSVEEIDLARPRENRRNPGFSDEERESFRQLLRAGFTDTFRHFYPDRREAYSWWSYRAGARERNIGWRLDYFLMSAAQLPQLREARIHPEVLGSDHCPVAIQLG